MLNTYEINNPTEGRSLIIYADSSSRKHLAEGCFTMYAKHGIEKIASPSNYDHVSIGGSTELVISNAKSGIYSLTLKGTAPDQPYCDYQIQYTTISDSDVALKAIKRGAVMDLEMDSETSKYQYFLYEHQSQKRNFKVVTMFSKIGEVIISAMPLAHT